MTFRKPLSEYYLKRSGWEVKACESDFSRDNFSNNWTFQLSKELKTKTAMTMGENFHGIDGLKPDLLRVSHFRRTFPLFFCFEPATNPPGFTWIICGSQWNAKEGESVRGIWARFKWFKHAYLFFFDGVFRARVCRWNIQTNRADLRRVSESRIVAGKLNLASLLWACLTQVLFEVGPKNTL